MDGNCVEMEVPASDSVRLLKESLSDKLQFSAARQMLVMDGKILEDGPTLADQGVVDGCVMSVCIKTPNPLGVCYDVALNKASLHDELLMGSRLRRAPTVA